MKNIHEIGGAYSMFDEQISCVFDSKIECTLRFAENQTFLSSGRGAINYLLREHIIVENKVALLPNYTCHTCVEPFLNEEYEVIYYKINDNLTVSIEDLNEKITTYNPSIVYFQTYFGFDTLKDIRSQYKNLKESGVIVVEDTTHSCLSDFPTIGADYYVCSLRKWLEIPDGGVLYSHDHEIKPTNAPEHSIIVNNFKEASLLKNDFLRTLDDKNKDKFRSLYYANDDILDEEKQVYSLSNVAANILNNADIEQIKKIRRENYTLLYSHLKNNRNIEIVLGELEDGVTPLYFMVYINTNRTDFQKYMANKQIYCPIHWTPTADIISKCSHDDLEFQQKILSIPCDQRYTANDMLRIVEAINNYDYDN